MAGPRHREPTALDRQKMWDLHADGYSIREIAREVQFAPATVSRYLSKMGADTDRSQTAEATAARVRKLRERRVNLAEALMEDAFSIRHRVWDKYLMVVNTPEGVDTIDLPEPPLPEQGHGIKSLDITVATIDRLLSGVDNDESEAAKSALDDIINGMNKLIEESGDAGLGERDQDSDYNIHDDPDQLNRD